MSKAQKRRASRRKLAAHDRGENRHAKGVMHVLKSQRLNAEKRARP